MIEKVIYLKYDELYLKGNNVNSFKQKLVSNLNQALKGLKYSLKNNFDNLVIESFDEDKTDLFVYIIKRIPGFSYCTIAYKLERNTDLLNSLCLDISKQNNYATFKIEAKRSDKKYELTSDKIKRLVAGYILMNNANIKVNIHEPELRINIEVKNNNFIVFTTKIECAKGLPVGMSGRTLMLLSGGIDSPVASDLLLKRGMSVDFITFISPPFTTDKSLEKVKKLVELITLNYRLEKPKLYVCNFTPIQNELTHIDMESYRITLLRRSFMRIANKVAKTFKYDALATGDSLGQVASQTIESMNVISDASEALILRPLLAFNKDKIINIAKKINTYSTSILPYEDSCSLFAPKNPVTKPKLHIAQNLETKLDLLYNLENKAFENIEVISYDKK